MAAGMTADLLCLGPNLDLSETLGRLRINSGLLLHAFAGDGAFKRRPDRPHSGSRGGESSHCALT